MVLFLCHHCGTHKYDNQEGEILLHICVFRNDFLSKCRSDVIVSFFMKSFSLLESLLNAIFPTTRRCFSAFSYKENKYSYIDAFSEEKKRFRNEACFDFTAISKQRILSADKTGLEAVIPLLHIRCIPQPSSSTFFFFQELYRRSPSLAPRCNRPGHCGC